MLKNTQYKVRIPSDHNFHFPLETFNYYKHRKELILTIFTIITQNLFYRAKSHKPVNEDNYWIRISLSVKDIFGLVCAIGVRNVNSKMRIILAVVFVAG